MLDQERIGFIERSGKMVIPAKYNDTKGFSNDRCLVHQGWGTT
ncbi:WG repeat-containing protein [Rhodopirellula baltica]